MVTTWESDPCEPGAVPYQVLQTLYEAQVHGKIRESARSMDHGLYFNNLYMQSQLSSL